METVKVTGPIVPNSSKWIYDWLEIEAILRIWKKLSKKPGAKTLLSGLIPEAVMWAPAMKWHTL